MLSRSHHSIPLERTPELSFLWNLLIFFTPSPFFFNSSHYSLDLELSHHLTIFYSYTLPFPHSLTCSQFSLPPDTWPFIPYVTVEFALINFSPPIYSPESGLQAISMTLTDLARFLRLFKPNGSLQFQTSRCNVASVLFLHNHWIKSQKLCIYH